MTHNIKEIFWIFGNIDRFISNKRDKAYYSNYKADMYIIKKLKQRWHNSQWIYPFEDQKKHFQLKSFSK
jgi:hypothetical protein